MKKRLILVISLFVVMVMILVGCGKNENNQALNQGESNSQTKKGQDNTGSDISSDDNTEDGNPGNEELKEPIMTFCQLYNPNGFNTVTGFLKNPNNVDIDVSYDIVFYKDGNEVHRDNYMNCNISPNHEDIIWGNYGLPNPEEVDEIKLENMEVSPSNYESIDAKIELNRVDDSKAYYDCVFAKEIEMANIWFVLYNDTNKNDEVDEGEIVGTSVHSLINGENEAYFETNVTPYEKVKVYYNAYK